ncbi:hypothetical protein HK101_007055 [Irineochytrium annulatum]|nr:hypothetical protein HK101_007055 [Irineochytrium annulatum]
MTRSKKFNGTHLRTEGNGGKNGTKKGGHGGHNWGAYGDELQDIEDPRIAPRRVTSPIEKVQIIAAPPSPTRQQPPRAAKVSKRKNQSKADVLRIKVGPGYDPATLQTAYVNDELNPIPIQSEHFTGYLVVRMVNFAGLTPEDASTGKPLPCISNPSSGYFKGRNRRYSFALQGRWTKSWTGEELMFGMDCDQRVRAPAGVNLAVKIAKWLDPALDADLSAEKPWIYSPFVSAMNALAIYKSGDPNVLDVATGTGTNLTATSEPAAATTKKNKIQPAPARKSASELAEKSSTSVSDPKRSEAATRLSSEVGIWSFHTRMVPEDCAALFPPGTPAKVLANVSTYEKRKRFFGDAANRKAAEITPDKIYCMDFYDAYFDFNTVSLKLPGFSINGFKYFDGQVFRFVCRSKDRSATFFTIHFELVDRSTIGEDAPASLAAEKAVKGADAEEEEEDVFIEFPPEMLPPPEILKEE